MGLYEVLVLIALLMVIITLIKHIILKSQVEFEIQQLKNLLQRRTESQRNKVSF